MAQALESLLQILENDQHHLTLNCRTKIESLLQQLRDLVKNSPGIFRRGGILLDTRIRDAAEEAEDVVESHIIDQVLSRASGQLDLTAVMKKFHSIRRSAYVLNIVPKYLKHPNLKPDPAASLLQEPDPILNNKVVGFDDDLSRMIRLLGGTEAALGIIPMVGMGGIGKTTFAGAIYSHAFVASHFDVHAWVTISQRFDARRTLLALLHSLSVLTDEMLPQNEHKLGEVVHKTLKCRRYLIVVDDIWDNWCWDKLRMFFPDDGKGSRIIVTTRHWDVANYVLTTDTYVHRMHLLDEGNSWHLLVENVFGGEPCPHELVQIGKRIAKKCNGLPLAIIVMAGHLCKSEKTLEYWMSVEKNSRLSLMEHDLWALDILSKSYDHLPYYLKPCFLYVGAFLGDNQIQASKIIKLWVAEGLIKPIAGNTLNDVAELYLNALIDRNLLSVCQQEFNGNVRTFKIHGLLRELCRIKAVEERFLWFRNSDDLQIPNGEGIVRRMSVDPSYQPSNEMERMTHVRSFLCFGSASNRLAPFLFSLKLLRVLDVFQLEFGQFPTEMLHLVNLRYLGLSCRSDLPHSISRFRNLQTLIIRLPLFTEVFLPSPIWEMTQLKHVKFKETHILYRPDVAQNVIQENLETLSNIEAFGITELLRKTPNLRKLGIYYDTPIDPSIDLSSLDKLEKLKCSSVWPPAHNFLSSLTLSPSLKKLTLSFCKIPSGFMTHVGSLPNLEQLNLQNSDFVAEEWEPTEPDLETTESEWEPAEEGFSQLISLTMTNLNLVYWTADNTHFPVLRRLIIRGCWSMRQIPLDIGDINTIELIGVDESSPSVVDSAKEIERQQRRRGNDSLQVVFYKAY